ncbi:MAG TPA: transglutaminase domain-containing protein [Anaerolineae bacterium]|nr:transglutaminase domain-containing protein [Anaerolineae bacterium]
MKKHLIVIAILILSSGASLLTPLPSIAESQAVSWAWLSPDGDGDGLPNDTETIGWCNSQGCFVTDPLKLDTDGDSLSDGEEHLFEADPTNADSPGIYVIYEDSFQTKDYYPWQPYGSKWIARGDPFSPPRPDLIDMQTGRPTDLDAIVIRRGTTFTVGGPPNTDLQISKSKSSLTTLSQSHDPETGRWRVTAPANGTVGKYTLTRGNKKLDLFVIFELPQPAGELTPRGIEKFLYDDNPNTGDDNASILVFTVRFPPGEPGYTPPPYPVSAGNEIKQGHSYAFDNQQYNRYLLEDYVITAINGATGQKTAADALAALVDQNTVFRNPHPRISSWRVLNPGANLRQQCSNVAGLLAAFSRAAGIPSRPIIVDWQHNTFDHANEVWLGGNWWVYRGYRTFEMADEPNEDLQGCSEPGWPACGTYNYYSRSSWGAGRYAPWHSGGDDIGNVLVLADENWTQTGLAYRWASWQIDRILLDTQRLVTQNTKYWSGFGWTQEPVDYGSPNQWPPAPGSAPALEPGGRLMEETGSDSTAVQLGEVVREYGVDLDGGPYYDQLVLEVEVTAAQAGSYWLWGQLSASPIEPAVRYSGGIVAESVAQLELKAGRQVAQLVFDGPEIALSRTSGPYRLSSLRVTDVNNPGPAEFMQRSLAYRGDLYTTAAYPATDFEAYGATLTDDYTHVVVDGDGDTQPDALSVTTGLNIQAPGNYTVAGSLYDAQDQYLGRASWSGTDPDVTLHFENVNGTIGPYRLRDVDVLNSAGESIDYLAEPYTIEAIPALTRPALASLNISRADLAPTDSVSASEYAFSESIVNGNLRVEAGVEIGQPGAYRLAAWLADASGNLLTWAMGQPTVLTAGPQTLALTFSGRAIHSRGVNGPYQVVALKVLAGSTGFNVTDQVRVALTTRAYTRNQFTPTTNILLFEDFAENGSNPWNAGSAWRITDNASVSPSHAWYASDASSSLAVAEPLDFSGIIEPTLKFHTAYELSGSERGYVEASTNGNTWTTLATYSGESTWSTPLVSLRAFEGRSAVWLRFRLASAGGASNDSWAIDDILIGALPPGTPRFWIHIPLLRR